MRKLIAFLIVFLASLPAYAQFMTGGGFGGGGGGSGGGGGGSITLPQTIGGTVNSGGIACFTSSTIMASSAALTANNILVGGGAGACPTTIAPGLSVLTTLEAAINATGGIVSPSPTRAGDIIYWNGSNWVTLAGNNSGTVYLSESSAGAPSWSSSSSSITFTTMCPASSTTGSTINLPNGIATVTETNSFTPTASQCGAWFDATANASLPVIGASAGQVESPYFLTIKDASTTSGSINVATTDSTDINYNNASATSITLAAGQSVGCAVNSTNTGWTCTGTVTGGVVPPVSTYVSGRWYTNNQAVSTTTYTVRTVSSIYCGPMQVNYPGMTVAQLGTFSDIADGTNYWGAAIYTVGTNGMPSALVDSIAPMHPTNVFMNETVNNGTDVLSPGLYYICDSTSSTTAKFVYYITAGGFAPLFDSSTIGAGTLTAALNSNGSVAITGVSCAAGGGCEGSPAWSGATFAWPSSLATSTWTDTSGAFITAFSWQEH